MRLLLDTNIIISAFLVRGSMPDRLLRAWLVSDRYELVTSHEQLAELERVCGYEHLRSRIVPQDIEDFRVVVDDRAIVVESIAEVTDSPDPSDNLILGAAVAGKADLIVSGDKTDVIDLEAVEGIEIVTVRQAWERLQEQSH